MQAQRGVLLLSHYTVNKEDDGDCDIEKASGFQFGPQVGIDLEFGFQFRPQVGILLPSLDFFWISLWDFILDFTIGNGCISLSASG